MPLRNYYTSWAPGTLWYTQHSTTNLIMQDDAMTGSSVKQGEAHVLRNTKTGDQTPHIQIRQPANSRQMDQGSLQGITINQKLGLTNALQMKNARIKVATAESSSTKFCVNEKSKQSEKAVSPRPPPPLPPPSSPPPLQPQHRRRRHRRRRLSSPGINCVTTSLLHSLHSNIPGVAHAICHDMTAMMAAVHCRGNNELCTD